jgi:hypothetical protein
MYQEAVELRPLAQPIDEAREWLRGLFNIPVVLEQVPRQATFVLSSNGTFGSRASMCAP